MSAINLQDSGQIYVSSNLLASLGVPTGPAPTAARRATGVPGSREGLLTRVCGDGERTEHLTRLVGTLIADGLSMDLVEHAALRWNANNNPPLPEQKVRDTVESLFRTHARNHPAVPVSSKQPEPLFDLAEADISILLRTPPKPREWLLQDLLPLGVVGMVVAPGGTGKSQLLLQLGVSIATGHPLCDHWPVGQPGSALLLFAEDDLPEIHRRLDVIKQELISRSPGFLELASKHLKILSMTGRSNMMTAALGASASVTATEYVDRLLLSAKQIPDLKLLVVDPASRFRGGSENSADDATRFIEQLERLAKELKCTVLVAQHVSKAGMKEKEQSQSAARGSSALSDGVRWQMNLAKPQGKDLESRYGIKPDQAHRFLVTSVTKNNYAAPQPEVVLHRQDGGYLRSTQSAGIAMTLDDRIVAIVKREAQAEKTYTAHKLVETFGGEDGELKAGKLAVRRAIDLLRSSGRLSGGTREALTVAAAGSQRPKDGERRRGSTSPATGSGLAAVLGVDPNHPELQAASAAVKASPEAIRDQFLAKTDSDSRRRVIQRAYEDHVGNKPPSDS